MRTYEAFYASGEATCQQTGDGESADDKAVAETNVGDWTDAGEAVAKRPCL